MNFENFEGLEESYSLDGVYEEIISFDPITEELLTALRTENFRKKMMNYIMRPLEA